MRCFPDAVGLRTHLSNVCSRRRTIHHAMEDMTRTAFRMHWATPMWRNRIVVSCAYEPHTSDSYVFSTATNKNAIKAIRTRVPVWAREEPFGILRIRISTFNDDIGVFGVDGTINEVVVIGIYVTFNGDRLPHNPPTKYHILIWWLDVGVDVDYRVIIRKRVLRHLTIRLDRNRTILKDKISA